MFLTYELFAPAFSSLSDLYMVSCVGDNEYEPDVVEYSVEVGENDCESECDVFRDVYVLSKVLCVESEVLCVFGDV